MTAIEIKGVISKLRNDKAYDDLPAEILKLAMENEEMISELESIFEIVWNENKIPEDWRKAKIECIFKNKGSKLEAQNYRGISIGSTIGKIFSSLIMQRLSPWYNDQLSLSQNGFRKGYGTNDAILRN